jgi:osmotically inducible protein OsmC
MNTSLQTLVYTAHTHTTGGRAGAGRSSDGALDVALSIPGSGKPGTNPEQLFGVGYSACFAGALQIAAAQYQIRLPDAMSVDAEVTLGKTAADDYQLAIQLNVNLPGLEGEVRRKLIDAAHRTCPYSRMTRGYVEVEIVSS